jgi:hypothetical protein
MEAFGLLPRGPTGDAAAEDALAVVEFGAGRGYLTQMLADCYGIKNIFLVERRSYKLKVSLCAPTTLVWGLGATTLHYVQGWSSLLVANFC